MADAAKRSTLLCRGRQFRELGGRAIRSSMHGGDALVVPIVFPLIIFAINTKALEAVTRIAGFPTKDVANFVIALAFLQSAIFAGIACAARMATDMESGFIKRFALAPMPIGLVFGARLAAVAATAIIQTCCYVAAITVAGSSIVTGVGGVVVLIGMAILFNATFAGIGMAFAVRSGSGEAVQSLFPVFFVLVMMSTALMPANLIEAGWFKTIVELNPVTYMLTAIRDLLFKGWVWNGVGIGAGLASLLLVAASLYTLQQMRKLIAAGAG